MAAYTYSVVYVYIYYPENALCLQFMAVAYLKYTYIDM